MRISKLSIKTHKLKILETFADDVCIGYKNFEIRKNDRGYQKGDVIKFTCIDERGNTLPHTISEKIYEITYVLNGYGLKNGFVVLGIKECEE